MEKISQGGIAPRWGRTNVFFDCNDGRIFFERYGSGAPIVCLHGGLGLDHSYFRPYLDPLSENAEIVYYDHRGNGQSSEPADWSTVDHATWVEDAEALRRHLGHERVVLFGHSYGGFLSLEYALRYPERLRGLILCATAPAFDYPEVVMANAQARGTAEQVAALSEGLSKPTPTDAAVRDVWEQILPLYFERLDPAVRERFLAGTRFRAKALNRSMLELLPHYNVTQRLREIDVPTLIVAGAHDWICPPKQGAERLTAIPGSRMVVFGESGHFPFIEEQDAFLRAVRTWLAGLS